MAKIQEESARKQRKSWIPDERQRRMVRQLATVGMSDTEIARVLDCGISGDDVARQCSDDIEMGRTQARVTLRSKMFNEASAGNSAALLHLVREIGGDDVVQTSELQEWLCCSRDAISEWTRKGILNRQTKGKYKLRDSVQRVVMHLRAVAAGRSSGEADQSLERALLARAQRESIEMDNEVKRGNLMDVALAHEEMGRIVGVMIKSLETLGDRVERDKRMSPDVVEYIRSAVDDTRTQMVKAIESL